MDIIKNDITMLDTIYSINIKDRLNRLISKNKNKIPKNAFGVFVTIKRSIKLPNYPEDIHGCMGYWTSDYSILPYKELILHLIESGNNAIYNDKRRQYFLPIETDLDAIIEIDFMLKPIIPINEINGTLPDGSLFKNSKYGLIFKRIDSNISRATYLPFVFPDTISWNKIKNSLISKAGLQQITNSSNSKNSFLAYSIIQLKDKLFDIIDFDKQFMVLCNSFIKNFVKYTIKLNLNIKNNSDKFIPYTIKNSNVRINKDDDVRNLSIIECFVKCINKVFSNEKYSSSILEIINVSRYVIIFYIKYLTNSNNYLAYANLVSLMSAWNKLINNEFKISKKIIAKLKLRIPNAEIDFERGQIILAILEYMHNNNNKYIELYLFIKYVSEIYINDSNKNKYTLDLNNVFKMNWDSQVLSKLCILYEKLDNTSEISNASNFTNIKKIIKKIVLEYIKLYKILEDENKIDTLESNYLVVIFEGCNTIINMNKQITNPIISQIYIKKLNYILNHIFNILMKTRYSNGIVYFKDKSARLDITGHLLNSFL
jgi:hypothetical protein